MWLLLNLPGAAGDVMMRGSRLLGAAAAAGTDPTAKITTAENGTAGTEMAGTETAAQQTADIETEEMEVAEGRTGQIPTKPNIS